MPLLVTKAHRSADSVLREQILRTPLFNCLRMPQRCRQALDYPRAPQTRPRVAIAALPPAVPHESHGYSFPHPVCARPVSHRENVRRGSYSQCRAAGRYLTSITTSEPRAGHRRGARLPKPRPAARRTIVPSCPTYRRAFTGSLPAVNDFKLEASSPKRTPGEEVSVAV